MSEHTDINEDQLVDGRRDKHEGVLASGGYPHRFERSHLASEIHGTYRDLEAGSETEDRVTVAGRLMLHRSFGKLQFGTVQDVTGSIQLFVESRTAGDEVSARFAELDLGDWVGASGVIMTTKKGELSVKVDGLTLLQKALRPLPDKWHGLVDVETRSRQRYVDLMVSPDARRTALVRSGVVSALRREFEARGFVEVETPILLSQATGALARPFVTRHNALGIDLQLRIATELYLKRLVVGGIEKVFEIGRIFRNEGIDATHNPEFTMLEAYQAFADYGDIMDLVEEVISAVAQSVTGTDQLVAYQGRDLSFAPPFERVRLVDLVSHFVGETVDYDTDPERLAELLTGRGVVVHDAWGPGKRLFELYELAHKEIWHPTFVMDFPTEVSPLSRKSPGDPRVTERFELVIAGAEYCNAFSELNDADDQRSRFEAQAAARADGNEEAHVIDEDYIRALEFGLPPTGGLGIGVDRLVMLLTDQPHIREVILFPTLRPES
jgi:lysyl-tRNA synthetase, class II